MPSTLTKTKRQIEIIEPKLQSNSEAKETSEKKKRVAAYARVSNEQDEQKTAMRRK